MMKVFMKMKSGLKGYTVFGSGKSWLGKKYVQITNEKKKPHPNRLSFFVNSLLHSELFLNQYVYCVHVILIPLLLLVVFMH